MRLCANAPYACDLATDRELARLAKRGSNEARTAFDRTIAERARVVPLFNLKATDFVSRRLGNYQRHPLFGLLISQVWVR